MSTFGREAAAQDLARVLTFRETITHHATGLVRPSVVAGIISRETRGRRMYFIGDKGHGCGPMQIDDRSYPTMCTDYKSGKLNDLDMIALGCVVLREAIEHTGSERSGIAAYNCGSGNVHRALSQGLDVDHFTWPSAGVPEGGPKPPGDYSRDVLERAAFYELNGFGGK